MVYTVDEARVRNPPRDRLLRYYTGCPKKWCTFFNAVIRSGKQVEKWLKDPQSFQLSTTFKCQFAKKLCIFVKHGQYINLSYLFKSTIANVFLPKNSISEAKNILKWESTLFLPLLILMKTMKK